MHCFVVVAVLAWITAVLEGIWQASQDAGHISKIGLPSKSSLQFCEGFSELQMLG